MIRDKYTVYGYREDRIYPGMKIGRLTILNKGGYRQILDSGNVYKLWVCKCDCGDIVSIPARNLISSNPTKSCGKCPHRLDVRLNEHKLYSVADGILNRCRHSKEYGGRGIKCELGSIPSEVCKSLDKVPGYFDGAYIDRIDNNGNYTIHHPIHGDKVWIYHDPNTGEDYQALGNLRWVSNKVNNLNKRDTVKLEEIHLKPRPASNMRKICVSRGWDMKDFYKIKAYDAPYGPLWYYHKRG